MRVAVISGGFSEEHNSSRESGKYIAEALEKLGHDVWVVEYNENLISSLASIAPQAAFPIVQGKHHGDGAVQSLLELAGIPYVGSRPQYAAVINHKTVCKRIWRSAGIPTPEFFEYSRDEYLSDDFTAFETKAKEYGLTLPVVVKPPTQGNRFGIVFFKDSRSFPELAESFRYDDTLLVERYVEGLFYTQGIIEIDGRLTAIPPVKIIDDSNSEFKLYPGGSRVVPHDLAPLRVLEISRITLEAARLTGASGFARLDYHLCGDELHLLEINAVPGLVPGYSSMNICAEAAGYDYETLIETLLTTAK